ncbi:MAG: RNA 2',3'-cyclic phosphodiesterase [Nanoarchaeota archaeon]|nr:RNA 2',3'-cyclic phosphodiesterase [Nanoarchaeota archaeon]
MRTFIAITLASPELDLYKQQLKQPGITPTRHNHITLQFLGDISQKQLADVQEKLATITFKPFTLITTCLDQFSQHPNILWLGVKSKELTLLQKNIQEILPSSLTLEKIFRPHITLARVKIKHWKNTEHSPPQLTVLIDKFLLYTSMLGQRGPSYTIISTYPLH